MADDTRVTCPDRGQEGALPGGNPSGGTDGADRAENATERLVPIHDGDAVWPVDRDAAAVRHVAGEQP